LALDIVGIKTAFKTVLDGANSAGAAYDLSMSLTSRVANVLTRSMNSEMFNADVLPCVSIYTDKKKVDISGICSTQLLSKRQATVSFQIAGVVWNSNFDSIDKDNANDDIEKLMENIEEVLRRSDTLGGTVQRHAVTNVTYHDWARSEQEHYRVGILDVDVVKFY
jgi:hypothetical protein